jgi:hypothetical protein
MVRARLVRRLTSARAGARRSWLAEYRELWEARFDRLDAFLAGIIPEAYRKLVTRVNGDVLPSLLVDGQVAGVWRPVDGGIETTAFHPLADDAWAGLDAEARRLVSFLADRDPAVYRRFGRWWAELPGAEIRVLGG